MANNASNVPDMPLGLGMKLAQDIEAMSFFGSLNNMEKTNIINYIQSSTTGPEAAERVGTTVNMLKEHRSDFY